MPCNAEQFAAALAENFQGVTYDAKKRSGTASVPNVGTIEFREAGSDPAVIVHLYNTKRFKGTAETAVHFIEELMEAWSNSD
jgi:hypothetical protein